MFNTQWKRGPRKHIFLNFIFEVLNETSLDLANASRTLT